MGLLALYISNVIVSGIGFEWERIERREEGENGRFKFRTALTGTCLRADKRLWKVVKKKNILRYLIPESLLLPLIHCSLLSKNHFRFLATLYM